MQTLQYPFVPSTHNYNHVKRWNKKNSVQTELKPQEIPNIYCKVLASHITNTCLYPKKETLLYPSIDTIPIPHQQTVPSQPSIHDANEKLFHIGIAGLTYCVHVLFPQALHTFPVQKITQLYPRRNFQNTYHYCYAKLASMHTSAFFEYTCILHCEEILAFLCSSNVTPLL